MSDRERHIRELAAELGVEARLDPDAYAIPPFIPASYAGKTNGYSEPGEIAVWGFDGRPAAYFAALHELGHVALHWSDPRGVWAAAKSRIVEAEAEAWDWALEHAEEPPDEETKELLATDWLGSYARDWPDFLREGQRGPVFRRVNETLGLGLR